LGKSKKKLPKRMIKTGGYGSIVYELTKNKLYVDIGIPKIIQQTSLISYEKLVKYGYVAL